MADEYEKGQEIGRLEGKLESIEQLLRNHIEKQDQWNLGMDKRVRVVEAWLQTTTGKIVILTAIAGAVGSGIYFLVTWYFNHKFQ